MQYVTRRNFNSIKVRLKQLVNSYILILLTFQFHKGTIKTQDRWGDNYAYDLFQFHKGTIKTYARRVHQSF